MSITRAIKKKHFEMMEKRGWDKTYWFFDIHDTIIRPNYKAGDIPTEFFPYAKEALQMISKRKDVCLGLYTCSHPHEIEEYLQFFRDNDIHFEYVNENPEVKTENGGYGCYDKKPYFNVLFEDKAGFDADTEWIEVINLLNANTDDEVNK